MKNEIAVYITKEIHPSGIFSKFILSTNKHSGSCWFNGLPPQKHGDGVEVHESFNGQLNELLRPSKLAVGDYEIKVFYSLEYKTISKVTVEKAQDSSQSCNTKSTTHLIPMKEEEILHFMNLFNGYKK